MRERKKHSHHRAAPPSATRLTEEIEALERRLQEIGPDGDCGYENALVRFFEQQIGLRREMLRSAD